MPALGSPVVCLHNSIASAGFRSGRAEDRIDAEDESQVSFQGRLVDRNRIDRLDDRRAHPDVHRSPYRAARCIRSGLRREERRRLERNIHDGAQQQLVALAVKQRLVASLVEKDSGKALEVLGALQQDTTEALENLRDLARGIYPPLLVDKGLVVALEAQARKSPVPVTVESDRIGRFPQEIEAAVYFCCLEALQNIAKYADASTALVRLSQTNGELSFEVEDDGRGFDANSTTHGTGLQGIADRLAALDGTMQVRSSPGSGTTLRGMIPASRP